MQTETALAEDEIQWELLSTGRLPATEEPHVRQPLTQNPVSTQPLTRESLHSNPRPTPQVATFAEVCSQQKITEYLDAYPTIFDLRESNITTTPEQMDILSSLPQPKRSALLIIVEQPTRHIRVLWGIEKLPYSYANKTALDGRVVAFSRDIVAGNTPPTIAVNEECWDKDELPVPTETVAYHEVAKLQPQDTSIPKASLGESTISLSRACIAPLTLAHPLLTALYLSPAAAYALLAAKVHAKKWDTPLKPLMTWLRSSLYAARPGVTSLPLLELADHITVGRQNLQKAMVPSNSSSSAAPAPTYKIQSQPAPQAAPAKDKKTG